MSVEPLVSLVVPFGVNGAAHQVACAIAQALGETGLSVELEAVPGQGGLSGLARATRLAREGRPVLLMATPTTHVLAGHNPALNTARGAQPPMSDEIDLACFQPLLDLGRAPNVLIASAALPVSNIADLRDFARRSPSPLVCGNAGLYQTLHLCAALLAQRTGIAIDHRAYVAGSAAAYPDLCRGELALHFDSLIGLRVQLPCAAIRPLAISAPARLAEWPALPTLSEAGVPDHCLSVWFGLVGAQLSATVQERVSALTGQARLAARLRALGLSEPLHDRDSLADEIRTSAARWQEALTIAAGAAARPS